MKPIILFIMLLFSLSLASAVSVTDIEIYELGEDGFVVGWQTDQPATSQILYGLSGRLGQSSSQNSLLSTDHQIQINNLEDDTIYFFRATGENSRGESYFSVIGVTKTSPGDSSNSNFIQDFYIYGGEDGTNRGIVQTRDTIDVSAYPQRSSVGVLVSSEVESVLFFLDGEYRRTENTAPYSMYGHFYEWEVPDGTYDFRAIAYGGDCNYAVADCDAAVLEDRSIQVTVVNMDTTTTPPQAPPPSTSGVPAENFGMRANDPGFDNGPAFTNMVRAHRRGEVSVVNFNGVYNFDTTTNLDRVDGLTLQGTGNTRATFTSNNLHSLIQTEDYANNLVVQNIKFESTASRAMSISEGNGAALIGFFGNCENHFFENNEFTAPNMFTNGIKHYVTPGETCHDLTYRNNYVHDLGRMGIEHVSHHIYDNQIWDLEFSNNRIERTGRITSADTNGMGISLSGSVGEALIENNYFNDNPSTSIELVGTIDSQVRGNTFVGDGGPIHFLQAGSLTGGPKAHQNLEGEIRYSENILVENNDASQAQEALLFMGTTNIVLKNNQWNSQTHSYTRGAQNIQFSDEKITSSTPIALFQFDSHEELSNSLTFENSVLEQTGTGTIFTGSSSIITMICGELRIPSGNWFGIPINAQGTQYYSSGNLQRTANGGNCVSNSPPPNSASESNTIFTPSAKAELQRRLANGYRTTSRHDDDFANMKTEVAAFNANTIESRLTEYYPLIRQRIPESGRRPNSAYDGINTEIYRTGPGGPQFKPMERPFLAAIYAYLTDDVTTANNVMRELIWLANNDDLDPSNGRSKTNSKHGTFERWPDDVWLTNPPFFTIFSYIGKWMEAYELVKDIETVSSSNDRARVKQWFKDFEVYGREESEYFMGLFMGNDWRNGNPQIYADAGEFSFSGSSRPVQSRSGATDNRFIISNAQNRYNNRQTGIIDYIHAYGITFNDAEAKDFGEDYFRQYFKFMVFPDGTNAELFRSNADLPERGVVYHWVTATHLTKMAHRHAVAVENGLPSVTGESTGKLFDYTTTDGFVQGSTRYGSSYGGSSTTDGSTPKGLGMYVRTIPNYYRASRYGGWTDVRYNSGQSIDGSRILKYTAPGAFVNLWYNDQELKEYYQMDTSQGYPNYSPDYIGEWGRDVGPWGTLYGVGFWSDMENTFFS